MDQLKTQLAVIGKHGFWISSVLVLLVSLGIWYMSTTNLQEENDSQTSKITGKINSVSQVQGLLDSLPNDLSHQEMEKLISTRQGEVLESWEKLYDRQKDILVWPKNTFDDRFLLLGLAVLLRAELCLYKKMHEKVLLVVGAYKKGMDRLILLLACPSRLFGCAWLVRTVLKCR